jgi:hypothetical protein
MTFRMFHSANRCIGSYTKITTVLTFGLLFVLLPESQKGQTGEDENEEVHYSEFALGEPRLGGE